ncbi:MAG TPA: sigma-54 dependent transcriptional regulator [Dissulfurispiraceae bacterium]|nr:sigma-54 dependent transcriptional regulator [Dissulfurispiraceae bacterium]
MRALIVDDEPNIRKVLAHILQETGVSAHEAGTLAAARAALDDLYFDLCIVDIRLPDGTGMDLLRAVKEASPDAVVLMITAFASAETAIEAMKNGAYDYVTKPFNIDEIRIVLKNIREKLTLEDRVRSLQQFADEYQSIVGKSEAMQRLFSVVDKIAPFDSHVLIIGESGTGKELVAKAIHAKSRRHAKSLIAINCASLPEELLESELFGYMKGAFTGAYASRRGLIEDADGGTLFLDEIGEMPLSLQAKLLRFLEEKKIRPLGSGRETEVDVRVVAATNKLLREMTAKGSFREDLYYRLATFELNLPSLRERREDIPLLISHFAKAFSRKFDKTVSRIDPGFVDYVMKLDLRGNVRELKNIIEREIILSEDGILKNSASASGADAALPATAVPAGGMNLDEHLSRVEQELLASALQQADGVKTRAAELLGLTLREYRYRLAKYR